MKEYNPNGPSEMLNLLLDGELDGMRESLLYKSLAENAETQSELKDILNIRQAIAKDVEAFTPPSGAAANIFKELGYAVPAGSLSENAVSGFWSKFAKRATVTTAFLAMIGLGANYLPVNNPGNSSQKAVIAKTEVKKAIPIVSSVEDIKAPKIEKSAAKPLIQPEKGAFAVRTATASKSIVRTLKENVDINNVVAANQLPPVQNLPMPDKLEAPVNDTRLLALLSPVENIGRINASFGLRNQSRADIIRSRNIFESNRSLLNIGDNPVSNDYQERFSLFVRNIYATSNPENSLQSSGKNSTLTNFSLGGFVYISDNLSFGAEVGQEPFGQVFITDSKSPDQKYDQGPNVFWFGLATRYDLNEAKFIGLNPFGQFFIGGSTLGPLTRAMAGLQWPVPGSSIIISGGYEGSFLWYKNQNIWYSTNKQGIIFGLIYKF